MEIPARSLSTLLWLVLAGCLMASPARAQNGLTLDALARRLEAVEQQNADLREEIRLLRLEFDRLKQPGPDGQPATAASLDTLEEKIDIQAGRLAEHDQIKVEGSQRAPIRLTGMALVNLFYNTSHANPNRNYGAAARVNPSPNNNAGASLRQSVIGLELQSPGAVLGGQFRGSVLLDFDSSPVLPDRPLQVDLNTVPRLRTAWVEGRWGSRAILVGQDKMIFSPREPNSLAQIRVSPLSGQGNLYGWRPQVRFEQNVKLNDRQNVQAQVAVAQTSEDWPQIQQQFQPTLEPKRPALETYVRVSHQIDEARRVEIGSGYHRSATHVAGTSIPSRVYALDWFVNPLPKVEVAGFWFTGKNVGKSSARPMHGFTILTPRPGVVQGIPIRAKGGWTQVTFLPTPRMTLNLSGGREDPDDRDLLSEMIARNTAYVASAFYRLAPNVVFGTEVAQVLTRYKAGQRPRYNHYDLFLAFLF